MREPISEDEDEERESTLIALYMGGGTGTGLVEGSTTDKGLSVFDCGEGDVWMDRERNGRTTPSSGVGGSCNCCACASALALPALTTLSTAFARALASWALDDMNGANILHASSSSNRRS